MKLLIYSASSDKSIETQLGMADYSYYFVKNIFVPVLSRFGTVIDIEDPKRQVDQYYDEAALEGELCLFFSFTPPHKTETGLRCPTLCVFAWEYGTLPHDPWNSDEKNDWRHVLGRHGFTITHSNFAARVVREALREDFPVMSLPAPLWDTVQSVRRKGIIPPQDLHFSLNLKALIIDTHALDLGSLSAASLGAVIADACQAPIEGSLDVSGVVYSSIFNPNDGRKNWQDLVTAFCWAFREVEDATLILKLSYRDAAFSFAIVMEELRKLAPFRCRVLLIHGFLSDNAYQQLIECSHYTVNSSYGEGQCLPLMEFMSAGRPAIAPDHTAMADYLNGDNAFVVSSSREWTHWPHDPRALKRTFRYRVDWQTLLDGYLESYQVAKNDWARYARMSVAATESLRQHCSQDVIAKKMALLIGQRVANHALFRQGGQNLNIHHGGMAAMRGLGQRLLRYIDKVYRGLFA